MKKPREAANFRGHGQNLNERLDMAILAQAVPVPARPPGRKPAPRRITYATATPPDSVNPGPDRPVSSSVSSAFSDCPAVPREATASFVHGSKKSSKIKAYSPSRQKVRKHIAALMDAEKATGTGKKPSGYSVIGCGVWAIYGYGPEAPHNSTPVRRSSFISGRFRCNTLHCPHCASLKAADYRAYMKSSIFPAMAAHSLTGDLLTFTLSHSMNSDWKQVRKSLTAAFSHMHNRIRRVFDAFGVVGFMKSLESPVGSNGLHPHYHLLLVRPLSLTQEQVNQLREKIRVQWSKSLLACGGHCNEHGFDYKSNCINDYIALFESGDDAQAQAVQKQNRSTSYELSAHDTKNARSAGRTFVQLLHDSMRGDALAGKHFLRWSAAMSGSKRFDTQALSKSLGVPSFEEWKAQQKDDSVTKQSEFDAFPDHEKLTINIQQDVVNVLSNSPVRDYYPFVLDYGERLCRDLTPENKPEKLKQWQRLFDRCLEEHRKYMAMRPHLMMDDSQIEKIISLSHTRPLYPAEIAAYHTARVLYYRKPAQVNKLRRVFEHFEAVSS